MVSSSWVDEGIGCCSGPRNAGTGKLWGGGVKNLNACKAKCMTFDNCGYIEYGWRGSTFCYIWSTKQACSSMSSGARDCGSNGNTGVRTYKYVADVPSGQCADLAGFWVADGKPVETATTIMQTGCDATAIKADQTSASGKVRGNAVSMFGQTGSYDDGKLYWSGGSVWVRNVQDCEAICSPGSCAGNKCECGSAGRSGLTCGLEGICRYSPSFDWSSLPYDSATQDEYIRKMLRWDGEFAMPGRGVMPGSYLTCDHVMVTPDGSPGSVGAYTAASKESLHISMLALVVSKTKHAWHWIADADSEDDAVLKARDRLKAIIGAYEKLNKEMPGLGGFLPWCSVNKGGFWINGKKNIAIPGLDNGQLAWSMLAAAEALRIGGFTAVADQYQAHIDLMKKSAPILFLDPNRGTVYMMSKVKDTLAPPSVDNRVGQGQLGDPYEGELMIMFLDLMCYWPDPSRRALMWRSVKNNQVVVQYKHEGLPEGPITVQRGWRFSAHELWKYIVLPYTDDELVAQVLANGEKARTWNSKLKNLPGLMGSCYNWKGKYIDRYGIREVSMGFTEPARDEMMVTAYGAMGLLIADRGMGLAWHNAMMSRPESQTVMGSIEASQAYGTNVAMKVSWDTKVTADLAALGGTLWLTRRIIDRDFARKKRFMALLDDLYGSKFTNILGSATPYAFPPGVVSYKEGTVTNADYNFPGYKIYKSESDARAACSAESGCLGIWSGIHHKPENWCILKRGKRTWKKGVPNQSVLSVKKKSEAKATSDNGPSSDFINCVRLEQSQSPKAQQKWQAIETQSGSLEGIFGNRYEVMNDTGSSVWMSPPLSNQPERGGTSQGLRWWNVWQPLLVSLLFFCLTLGCGLAVVLRFRKGKQNRFQTWALPSIPTPARPSYAYMPMQYTSGVSLGPEEGASTSADM